MAMDNAERHRRAAEDVETAVRYLKRAVKMEDGLEFTGALKDLIADAEEIPDQMRAYAADPNR